jgi:hypothetical protein
MSDFLALIELTPAAGREDVDRMAGHPCLELHRVEWLRCYLAADGARMLGWYRAVDAESVRLVLRKQGRPAARVWALDEAGAPATAPTAGDAVIVELELDPDPEPARAPDRRSAAAAALVDALRAAGRAPVRLFAARDGARVVGVLAGPDVDGVTRGLRAAGLGPTLVWRGSELVPGRPRGFRPPAAPATPDELPAASPRPAVRAGDHALDAVIIGAGVAGLCALQRLTSMGLAVRAYERGSDVGGVWHWNRYPGARLDSESYTYGFAFSDELRRD